MQCRAEVETIKISKRRHMFLRNTFAQQGAKTLHQLATQELVAFNCLYICCTACEKAISIASSLPCRFRLFAFAFALTLSLSPLSPFAFAFASWCGRGRSPPVLGIPLGASRGESEHDVLLPTGLECYQSCTHPSSSQTATLIALGM